MTDQFNEVARRETKPRSRGVLGSWWKVKRDQINLAT